MSPPKAQRRGQRGKAGAGSTATSSSSSSGREGSTKAGPNKTTLTKQSSTSSSSSSSSTTTAATTVTPGAREQPGRWNEEEHMLFLQGLQLYGKSWKKISTIVKTRTVVQIRTHAQKYLIKMEKAKKYGLTGVIMMDGKAIKRQAMEEAAAKCAGSSNKPTRTRRRRRRDEDDSTEDEEEDDERESSMDEGDDEYDVDDEHTSYGSEEDRVILTRPRRRNRTRRLIKDEHETYNTDAHTHAHSTHTHSPSSTPSSTTTVVGYNTSELHTISPAFCPSIPTDPLPLLDLPLDLLCDDADFLSNDTASCGGSDVSASTSSPSTLSCCSPYSSPLLTHSDVDTHAHTHTAAHTHTMDAFVLPSAADDGVCVSHTHSVCVQPQTQQAHTQTQHTPQVVGGGCACACGGEKAVCRGACVSGCGMVGSEEGAECVSNTPSVRVHSGVQMIMALHGYPPHTTHAATSPTLPFHDAHTHTHTTNPPTQTHTHILPTTPISSLLLNDEHDALSASLLDFDVDVWMMDGVLLEDVCA